MQMPKLLIAIEGDIKGSHIVRIIEDGEERVLRVGGWLGRAVAFHDAFPRLLKLIRSIGQDVTGEVESLEHRVKAWFEAAAADPPAASAPAPNPPAEASSAAPPPDAAAAAPGAGSAP